MAIEWRTERWKISDLKDYPHNPRKFTEKGLAALMASMKTLGYIDPIAINTDGTIIGGHARRKTLIEMGLSAIDVRLPSRALTDDEVKQAIIRLNRNTAGEWDYKMLEDEFSQQELIEWGFEKSEFNSFGKTGKCDPDAEIELPPVAVTVRGDQWVLGNHIIRCGDSTMQADVLALLGDCKPNLMVTDPPYGVNYDASWRIGHENSGKGFTGTSGRALGKVENDDRADWAEAYALFPGNIVYIWHGGLHSSEVANGIIKCGFKLRAQIIWVKQHFVFGRGDFHWQHEPCWYAVKEKGNWKGGRKQTTIWEISNNNPFGAGAKEEKLGHSTQKPVECMKRPIENNSDIGDSIYEPFSGSGTTIIASEMTRRKCFAMELNPLYVDMAIMRWEKFTGSAARHAITGELFKSGKIKRLVKNVAAQPVQNARRGGQVKKEKAK